MLHIDERDNAGVLGHCRSTVSHASKLLQGGVFDSWNSDSTRAGAVSGWSAGTLGLA